ncbi:hypothetical protein ACLQ2R_34925 [Streptosporangium sp. DT93]|uniref:hypothetical protein n=1 Tax=Streptosporangium sp. DT93 TaxID=3393428 RepID=UPI003CEF997C
MVDALRVSLLVTTDLPPDTDLTEFGELLVDSVRTLQRGEVTYPALLRGGVFWLDRPLPPPDDDGLAVAATGELRFAALLGHLSVACPPGSAKETVADAGRAITTAVAARYGDLGSPPAVMAIRGEDVRERTPESAVRVGPGTSAEPVPHAQSVAQARPVPHGESVSRARPVPHEESVPRGESVPHGEPVARGESVAQARPVPHVTARPVVPPVAPPAPSAVPREKPASARTLSTSA